MKKLLFVALAAVGMASCVQTEELAVANNNQAIGFDTFVDNVTKTLYDNNNLTYFNVYGTITADNGGVITNIFPGVEVSNATGVWAYDQQYTQYWIPGFTYKFAAVVGAKNDKAVVGLDTNGMPATISTNLEDQEDILYNEVAKHFGTNDTAAKVSFQFAHLLSKAKFTVKNGIVNGKNFVYNVESIKIKNADKNAAYEVATGKWTATNTYEASFGAINAIAQTDLQGKGNDTEVLLVPGTKELAIEIAYKLTYNGAELVNTTKNLTAVLTLEQGKAYNFVVEFGKPGEDIKFDAQVKDWVENDVQTPSVWVTTAEEFKAALSNPSVAGAVLGNDITLSETISRAEAEAGATIAKSFTIDGNGKTLTYTGTDRAIDIRSDVENETYKNVTIKNLTINCSASYCQRGINYNANGSLILDNVKVGGKNVTYALNLPGMSDNATVQIIESELTGCIALNVWGENMKIDVNNSILTSVDKTEVENYSAVVLNNDGTTMANGTVVNITGGKVIALNEKGEPSYAVKNNSLTGVVNIDETTEVVGEISQNVAIVYFDGANEFYGSVSLAEAVETYFKNPTADGIRLIRDIELEETLVIPAGKPVVLDLNGCALTIENAETTYALCNLGTLTLKDSSNGNGSVTARGIYNGYDNGTPVPTAKLTVESGTFNAVGPNGGAAVYNYGELEVKGGKFTAVGSYALNTQSGGKMTVYGGETVNGGIYLSGTELVIEGGKVHNGISGRHTIYSWNSTVTINGGTIHNDNSGNATLMLAGSSVGTINGGTFSIKDGRVPGNGNTWTSCLLDTQNTATLTINNGAINGGFRVNAGTTCTINGGSFNDCYGSNYNIYGTVTVKGGTYTDAPAQNFAKKYVPAGYSVVEENGVWTVKEVVPYYKEGNTYHINTAAGLVEVAALTINGGENIVLEADIDLAGVEFNGLNAFNPGQNNTFDGRNHIVSNWTYTGKADDMGFIKNWVGPIKNLTVKNAVLRTGGRSAVIVAKPYGNIENCHVVDCNMQASYWACGLIAGMHNSGNMKNCTATDSYIKSTGGTAAITGVLNETGGVRTYEGCVATGCTINNGGEDPYTGAAIIGLVNLDNATVKLIGCDKVNNTCKGTTKDALVGYAEGNTVVVE